MSYAENARRAVPHRGVIRNMATHLEIAAERLTLPRPGWALAELAINVSDSA